MLVRLWQCSCGNKSEQEVVHSAVTQNISGEKTVWCSKCGSRPVGSQQYHNEPQWDNGCHHPATTYVGTVKDGEETYDVYMFYGRSVGRWEVCARFGGDEHQYATMGTIEDIKNVITTYGVLISNYVAVFNLLHTKGLIN